MDLLTSIEETILQQLLSHLRYDKNFAVHQYTTSYNWRYRIMRLIESKTSRYVYPCVNDDDKEIADFLDDNGFKVRRTLCDHDVLIIEVIRNEVRRR